MRVSEEEYRRITKARRAGRPHKPAKAPSAGEETLAARLEEIPELAGYHREYEFSPTRKWRLDFAWPAEKLAVEVESSVHRTKGRFGADIDKYNALALAGWSLLRFDRKRIESGKAVETIRAWMERRRG